jgi:Cu/Ag efflux protein CusF
VLTVVALLSLLGVFGCKPNRSATPRVSGPAAAVATNSYQGEGKIISITEQRPSIQIDHQEIKGLMPAMTMEFYVKEKLLLGGLKAGDRIEFSIDSGVGGLVITRIKRL